MSTNPVRRLAGVAVAALLATALLFSGSHVAGATGAKSPSDRTTVGATGRASRTAASATGRASRTAASAKPLTGKIVGIDPGHDGRNWTDPSYINRPVWNGREWEPCDTAGTETPGGYTEALFNWHVAQYLAADLRAKGAKVVLTRHSNDGVGPCVTRRAQIFRQAHVNVAVAIHGDGGPTNGRGFAILVPVKDGYNDRSVKPSWAFDRIMAKTFRAVTGMPYSTYDGHDGLKSRDDLAGTNLARYPYGLIECGNMRNASDARLMVRSSWQRRAALGIADSITKYLTRRS